MASSTLEIRALLVEFCRALARAMVEAAWYSPSHPDARKAVDHLLQSHTKLVEGQWGCQELHIATAAEGRFDEGLVSGVEAEPLRLSTLLHGTMGSHLNEQLLEFMSNNQLVSLGFERGLTRGDLEQFLVEVAQRVMASRRAASGGKAPDRALAGVPLREALDSLGIRRISVLSADEVVPGPNPKTSWLVRVNASRMLRSLRRLNLEQVDDGEQRTRLSRQVVSECFLSLGASWLRREFLVMAEGLPAPGVADAGSLQDLVARHMPESVRTSMAWELIGSFEDPGEAPERRDEARDLLRVLSRGLTPEAGPASADLLMLLHRRGLLAFKELPELLQDKLRVQQWTDQFLGDPTTYLEKLRGIDSPTLLSDYLTAIRFIFRDLLARGRHKEVLTLLRTLDELASDADNPWRRALVEQALDWIRRVDVAPTLAEAARTEDDAHRKLILSILKSLGIQMLFPLLTLLGHVRTAPARKDVCDTIRDMGPPVIPILVQELLRITHPWFLHRNILMLIGELGAREAEREVRRLLTHPHIRVREQAATTLVAIVGKDAEGDLIGALQTGDRDLQLRVVPLLVKVGCRDERFGDFLRHQIASLYGPENPDEALVGQCLQALTALGDPFAGDEKKSFEVMLLDILDPPLRRSLLRRAQGYRIGARLREQAVQTLCAIASSRSRVLLTRLSRDSTLGIRQAAEARLSSLDVA